MGIITDTNIWYAIGNGEIPESDVRNLHLVATNINITELSSTENFFKDYKEVQRAINAMFKFAKEIRLINPIEYALKIGFLDYKPNLIESNNKIKFLKMFVYAEDCMIQKMLIDSKFKKMVLDYDFSLNDGIDFINKTAPVIRDNIKKNIGKNQHRVSDTSNGIKELLKSMVNRAIPNSIDWKNYDWSKIDLFINVWDEYFKEIELSGTKFRKNDWLDLFNLIYVSSPNKYWTFEKSPWARIMKENKKTKQYVFNNEKEL